MIKKCFFVVFSTLDASCGRDAVAFKRGIGWLEMPWYDAMIETLRARLWLVGFRRIYSKIEPRKSFQGTEYLDWRS